mmetsp:Transcript_21259/g.49919  ORF Transcript_21259/g.49919 Transcript_21259/m.49919 type:complete len:93 (-) Transcript_21259:2272-2550(-)
MGDSGASKKVDSQKTSDGKPKQTGGKVKRKQLQSVPDLLSNGPDEGSSQTESLVMNAVWMLFLLIMFYLSLEVFLNIVKRRETSDAQQMGEL